MANIFYNFTYDGSLEGLLCVFLRCISTRVCPKSIETIYADNCSDEYTFVKTNYTLASRFYEYVERFSNSLVQQMLKEIFLTGLPNRELDMYMLVRKALWHGGGVADDFTDNDLRRIQMAIRDLYRESHSIVYDAIFNKRGDISISIINPRNRVLPIVMNNFLCDDRLDDFLLYDERHKMVLLRNNDMDYIIDITKFLMEPDIDTDYLYKNVWQHFVCNGNLKKIKPIHKCGQLNDSLTMLWDIAN
ncbi:MAG: DUF4130 domain-containing protein [Saccharofermentans sp.]|nr:DUF4130 domain-containing protein [Saccharofermentans sp.]